MSTRLHLPHPHRRRNRRRGAALLVDPAPLQPGGQTLVHDAHEPHLDALQPLKPDLDACKVREAGGPLDVAAYVCLCGFAFAAAVSTSVECPHCGAPQAW